MFSMQDVMVENAEGFEKNMTKEQSKPGEDCDLNGGHLKVRKTRSKSPIQKHLSQENDVEKSSSERTRSLSLDSVSPVSVALGSGKMVRVHSVAPSGKARSSNAKSAPPSPPLVVLKPRASSTGLPSQKFSPTTKRKVTILTPIGTKRSISPNISGQKRPLAQALPSSSGKIVLDVPEKKLKLPPNFATIKPLGVNKPITGKIKLNLCVGKQQKSQSSPVADPQIRGGLSGTPSTPTSKIKFENKAKVGPSKPTKSFILKTTKQGLIVMGQNAVVKEASTQASQSKTSFFQTKSSTTASQLPSTSTIGGSKTSGEKIRKVKVLNYDKNKYAPTLVTCSK